MAQKESRLAQILRQELKAGTNLPQALAMANVASLREKGDYRNLFPKSGVLGQVLRASLGKGYQYDRSVKSTSAGRGAAGNAAGTLTAGATRLTARNTMVLPAMARDMNIMKQNIASLVRATGKKSFARPERNYLGMGTKKPKPGAAAGSSSSGGGDSVLGKLFSGAGFAASLASGIVSNIFSVMGSMLSFGGSLISGAVGIIGSVLGGALNIGGGILGGLLGGLGSVVRGMGIFGIIALAGAGFLMYQISKNITGELSFDKIVNYIKESLGLDKGESFRDAMFRAFGFIDKKTGLNTQGAFVAVETKFIYWLEYSKSMFSQVATTVQKFGELAIVELQSGFLTYGTGLIKLLAQIYGTAIGAKAGVTGAGLASILMGTALGPAGTMGAMALRGLIAGGSFAGLTALGYSAGTGAGDAVNDALAGTALNQDQKDVLEKMQKTEGFISGLNRVNELTEQINDLKSKYKRPDGITPTYTEESSDIKTRRKEIELIKGNPIFSPIFKEFEKAFGKSPGNIHEDAITAARNNLDLRRQQILGSIPTAAAMRSEANQAAEERVAQHQENQTRTSPTRDVPVANFKASRVSSGHGYRISPISGEKEFHGGIDITGKPGESIYSAIDGKVTEVGYNGVDKGKRNGNYIFIQGPDGTITKYLHLQDKSELNVGDMVTAGQVIGKLGGTGSSTGPHLHFEVTNADGKGTINPMPFLDNITSSSPVVAVAPKPAPAAPAPAGGKDGIGDFLSGENKYDKMSESELLIEIMGDMFGDVTKVLSGMMSNLSKGGPGKVSDAGAADVLDMHGTQITQALQGRLFYSMTA